MRLPMLPLRRIRSPSLEPVLADHLDAALAPIADRLAAARAAPCCSPDEVPGSPVRGPRSVGWRRSRVRLTGSTALARGIFPDASTHLGIAGRVRQPTAMAQLREADVVVAFGAALNQFTTRFGQLIGPGTLLAQVDVEAAQTNPRVDVFVRADAAARRRGARRAPRRSALTLPGWTTDPASWSSPGSGR